MTDMNRRSFLGGALTVCAASVVPAIGQASGIPRIVGDGIHDDTLGLRALAEGKPFIADDFVIVRGDTVRVEGGNFRITGNIWFPGDRSVHFDRVIFHGDFDPLEPPVKANYPRGEGFGFGRFNE